MPTPDHQRAVAKSFNRRLSIERILVAIGVHGAGAVFDHLHTLRRLHRQDPDAFREVAWALREAGMAPLEVMMLVGRGREHPEDCACWRCLGKFGVEVARWRAAWDERRNFQ